MSVKTRYRDVTEEQRVRRGAGRLFYYEGGAYR